MSETEQMEQDVSTYQVQIQELTDELAKLTAQNEILTLKQQEMERVSTTRTRWNSLRERAHALCSGTQPRMTPAAFKAYFGKDSSEAESLVMRYSKPVGDEEALNLATVEAVIQHLEEHGQPVTTMGSLLADEPLEDRDLDGDKVAAEVATLKRFAKEKKLSKEAAIQKLGAAVSKAAVTRYQQEG